MAGGAEKQSESSDMRLVSAALSITATLRLMQVDKRRRRDARYSCAMTRGVIP